MIKKTNQGITIKIEGGAQVLLPADGLHEAGAKVIPMIGTVDAEILIVMIITGTAADVTGEIVKTEGPDEGAESGMTTAGAGIGGEDNSN